MPLSPLNVQRLLAMMMILFPAVLCHGPAEAQVRENRVIGAIQRDFETGRIGLGRKVLYQLQASTDPSGLPGRYAADLEFTAPLKCGTPFTMELEQRREELSADTRREADRLTAPSAGAAAETWLSPSGRFELHYETDGEDAVPPADGNGNGVPDFVERTGAAADSTRNHLVTRLGFTDPVTDSGPYEIYFRNFNLYGRTVRSGNTTYIEIHHNFEDFPENDDPEGSVLGAMKVTVAHELKHAIQYANSRWYSTPGGRGPHALTWSEMDATHMEEVVFDDVNDYYHYINDSDAIFISSAHRVPVAYSGVTWNIFAEEYYGMELWVEVWSRIRERYEEENLALVPEYPTMPEMLEEVLNGEYGESYAHAIARSHAWHYASGPLKSAIGEGFEERDRYPRPTINFLVSGAAETMSESRFLSAESAAYIEITPSEARLGRVAVDLAHANPENHVALVGYFHDGTAEMAVRTGNPAGITTLATGWNWSDVREVGFVIANSSESGADIQYRVFSAIPPTLELSPGYPNPFRDRTTIRYAVPEASRIQLKVYDINARLVRTLQDAVLGPGQYEAEFDGSGLASGVYLIRLTGAGQTRLEKITHIR